MEPRLSRLWLDDFHGRKAIRLDWDNDRHHSIAIKEPGTVDDVRAALLESAYLISGDPHLRAAAREGREG